MGQQRPDTKPGPRRAYRASPGAAGVGSPRGGGTWQQQAYPGAAAPRLETVPTNLGKYGLETAQEEQHKGMPVVRKQNATKHAKKGPS